MNASRDGEKTKVKKKTLILLALIVMVTLELVFWTLFFFSIWINDVWTFLGLGVLGVSALFIGQLRKEKAEKDAEEMFLNSGHKRTEKTTNE